MSGITRQEIQAVVEVQSKNAEQMVLIAQSMAQLREMVTILTGKINEEMHKGCKDHVTQNLALMSANMQGVITTIEEAKNSAAAAKADTRWIKWTITSVSGIILVIEVVFRVISFVQMKSI